MSGLRFRMSVAAALLWLTATASLAAGDPGSGHAAPVRRVLEAGSLGLFPATEFQLVPGTCVDCPVLKQALWYFRDDLVAVPKSGAPATAFSRGVAVQQDVRQWYAAAPPKKGMAIPSPVWIGSPSIVDDAMLQLAGDAVHVRGDVLRFSLTPKIPSNRSYYDASTARFFQQRPLRIRGRVEQGVDGKSVLVARTIWPQDYVIDAAQLKPAPLTAGESLSGLVRETGSSESRYETRLLWERNPGQPRNWSGLAALGLMLNGAQGDDDEAHGGHFAIVTGRLGARGEWADWTVNNFYNLDSYSEKGIIAAMLPMDNYLMDLNSGQSYYRPSYMLVALLRHDDAVYAYQGAMQLVFNHFYRHNFRYQHAAANCAGISVDTMRSLGWNIPKRGPTSYAKAVAAYPYMALKELSLESGKKSFDYLSEEQTRLYPAVAFDSAGVDLLALVGAVSGARPAVTAYEQLLQREVEAIVFVRIPQIPSNRAAGTFPVSSIAEYMKRAPEDRSKWKIIPVDPRPFPAEFEDEFTQRVGGNGGWILLVACCGVVGGFVGGILLLRAIKRRRIAKT